MGLTKPRASQIYNLDYKQATRVVTVDNINLSGGAPSQVDGVSLSANDRVLVTGQSTASQNGLYDVYTVGSGSNGTWIRTSDANSTGEIDAGMIVMVTEGIVYADTQWKLITNNPITIGSTSLVFTQNYSANSISGGTSNVTVYSNANVTISSAGTPNVLTVSSTGTVTSGTASITGNVTGGNILTTGIVSSSGNIYGGNLSVSGNITGNFEFDNVLSATGNIIGGNLLTAGEVSATGNLTGNYLLANIAYATGYTASKIYNGTSEIDIGSANGNANISIGGTSNVAVFATTGEYVTGVVSASGNVTGANLVTNGLITSSGNVISGNVLTAGQVSATGNVTGSNLITSGLLTATGNVTGGNILTSGVLSATGNLISGNISTGIVSATGNIYGGNLSVSGNIIGNFEFDNVLSATGNIIGGNLVTAGLITATGNVTGGNILTDGEVLATGNLTGDYLLANIAYATGYTASRIYNGTSEIDIATLDGNANISIGGTSNVAVFATTGEYVTGVVSASGNVTGANLVTDGVISALGNIYGSNLLINNNAIITGNLTVNGNTTFINSNTITTNDKNINLANNQNTGANVDGAGIDVGNNQIVTWRYNNATTSWQSNVGITPTANGTLNLGGTDNYWSTVYAVSQSISGNIVAGNISAVSYDGTDISVSGNTVAGNNLIGGNIFAFGNISTANDVTAIGNIVGNYFVGNGSQLTGILNSNISNGTSNVDIPVADGNVSIAINGAANTLIVSPGEVTIYGVYSNPKTITSNVEITENINSMLIGPVDVGPTGNIYIPDSSTLKVL